MSLLGGGNNAEFRVESVYTRETGIAGQPLTDGYHFGQTVVNDFGRPEEAGFNNVSGLSGWTADGPFAAIFGVNFSIRLRRPLAIEPASEAISLHDFIHSPFLPPFPVAPGTPTDTVNCFAFSTATSR